MKAPRFPFQILLLVLTWLLLPSRAQGAVAISDIPNQVISEDTVLGPLAFSITGLTTRDPVVTATSDNAALVATSGLVIGGTGGARTITVTPVANANGSATITVSVLDGRDSDTETFVLTVRAANDPPTISNVADVGVSEDTATGAIAFTVGDPETAAGSLTVTASSSNTSLVPLGNVVLGGSGANRTVTVTPAANLSGNSTITLTVSDGSLSASDTFVVTVSAVNDPPTISDIPNQAINEDTSTSGIAFIIGDVDSGQTAPLGVQAVSSDTTLIPAGGIVLGGTGNNRTIAVTPAANQFGTATITVTVSDGSASASDQFTVTVNSVNDLPTISNIADQVVNEDVATSAIAFTVGDLETPVANLTVQGTSSDTTVIPNANIVFGGTGANRTVTITPASNKSGSATITVIVSDGSGGTASDTFVIRVAAVNDPPSISNIADQMVNEDTSTPAITFTVDDPEFGPANLTVQAASSNTALVPVANIVLGGSGANRTVTLTPTANLTGTSTITLTVSDGTLSASDTFVLTVNAVNDSPTIGRLTSQSINEDTSTPTIAITVGDAETSAGSLVVTAASSDTTLVPLSGLVLGGTGANRTLVVTPAANQSGAATITVTVSDGSASSSASFALTVNPLNDAPTISDVADVGVNEDTATGAIAFTVGDVETAAASLTVTASTSNTSLVPSGNVVLGGSGANRTVTVTPAANLSGSSTITLTVSDGTTSTSDTFVVTVAAVNDPPTIADIPNQAINEDTSTSAIAFTIGDIDSGQAAPLGVQAVSSDATLIPAGGIVLDGTGNNRTITVTPAANQFGTATITVTVSDGSASASDQFTVTVAAVNDPPTISNIADQAILEDVATSALAFTVGDVETPAANLVVQGTSSDTAVIPNANIVFGGTGANRTVTVTPAANQSGSATITVTVSDGSGGTASDTFVVRISAVDDPPSISNVADRTIDEDTSTGAIAFTVDDPESGPANLVVQAASSNTTLVPAGGIVLGGSGANRTVTVTPAANQTGSATITLTVSAGNFSASDTFVLTVTPINDAPTVSRFADQSINEDSGTASYAVTVGDLETPVANLVLTASSSNTGLIPNANLTFGGAGANRTLSLAPAANQTGSATITVTVSDGALTATSSFVLTVNPVNDAPTISNIADQSLNENSSTPALAFTVGDIETPSANLVVTATSSNAALLPVGNIVFGGAGANRTVTITPASNQSGSSTVTVTVSDGVLSASDTILVLVNVVNDPPTISNIADITINEDGATAAIPFTVGDAETSPANLVVTATSSNASLVPNSSVVIAGAGANRTVTVTPIANASGSATITVTVSDGSLSASDTFVVTVAPINDAPTLTRFADQSINEDSGTASYAVTIGDVETPVDNLVLGATSSNTGLIPNASLTFAGTGANRVLNLAPAANQNGSATITVTVSDGVLTTTSAFLLTVNPVNDAPTISAIADQALNEDASTPAIAFTVGDVETPAASLVLSASSSNAALIPVGNVSFGGAGANRTVTITPVANQSGSATVTVTVSDGALTASDTFVVQVNAVNDPPTISNIADAVVNEDTTTPAIPFTVGDAETAVANLVVTVASSNPNLVPNSAIVPGGSGANRTLIITPVADGSGSATITVTVSDGSLSASDSFVLTVTPINDAPTLSRFADQSVNEDSGTASYALTIGDAETPIANLALGATSSNPGLVPNGSITFGGAGANRTINITPAANQFGATTVTVTVSDGSLSATSSFVLTVNAVNDTPTISAIPDQSINENGTAGPLSFTVGDVETAAASLTVTAAVSDATLFPAGAVTLGGSGANRTITVKPASNRSGSAIVTVTVSDGAASATDQFVVSVGAVNDPPTITAISDQTLNEDGATASLPFTIGDIDSPLASLTVQASSSDPVLVPTGGLSLGGSGANRTITITPAANRSGTATITILVSDGSASNTEQFAVLVNPVNDPPTISNIPDQSVQAGSSTPAVAFVVGDIETPVASLVVTASSSNPTIVPVNAIILGGSGANRTISVAPVGNVSATVTVTVTVSDGAAVATDSFQLTITQSAVAPKIVAAPQSATVKEGETAVFSVTVDGTAPFSYQWLQDGREIAGATEPTLVVRNASAAQGGAYSVKVSNAAGSITSPAGTLTVQRFDFGDAPESSIAVLYHTKAANKGPRHLIAPEFFLGARVDSEADGQPNADATGDDIAPANGFDDEDGVQFASDVIPGKPLALIVTASSKGVLDAWFDFNRVSGFETVEHAINKFQLVPGPNSILVNVPANAAVGVSYARFRLTRNGVDSPDDLGSTAPLLEGEVEDYAMTIKTAVEQLDFGDAPESPAGIAGGLGYPTTLQRNGARHVIVPGFFLGQRVDAEPDGQPSVSATGDDLNPKEPDDEDGVVFSSALTAGKTAQIIVTASQTGRLDAWIDFNRNKSWADPGDQIFQSIVLVTGPNSLSFPVPPGAQAGASYARFRFSKDGKQSFVGQARDGEVEDYLVNLEVEEPCNVDSKGGDFWVTFPGNYPESPGAPLKLVICIAGPQGTAGKVEIPGLNFSKDFVIPASLSVGITLPDAASLGDDVDVVNDKGIHVTANASVSVYGQSRIPFSADGFLGLPTEAVGRKYLVAAYPNIFNGVSALNGTQFAIVATADKTVVTIRPSRTVLGHPAGEPFTVELDAGQTYQLRDPEDATADLSGTEIEADLPIGVFAGHLCANINSPSRFYCDYLVEQLPPINAWSKLFHTVPLATRANGDMFRMVGSIDGTQIQINGAPQGTIDRGETRVFNLNAASRITTDRPVYLAQFANSSDFDGVKNADPFMAMVPPVRFYGTNHLVCTGTSDFPNHFINIVAPAASVGSVTVDGVAVPAAAFTPIAGAGYSYARRSVLPGAHVVASPLPIGTIVYGFGPYESYGWPGTLRFGDIIPPTIECPPDFTATIGGIDPKTGTAICQVAVPDLRQKAVVDDNCPAGTQRVVTQIPQPGTLVGVGEHVITLSVLDGAGNEGSCTTIMTVIDTGLPVLTCPKETLTVQCNKGAGAAVAYQVIAKTPCGTLVPVECVPPSGAVFQPGVTEVKCTVQGFPTLTCAFKVNVICPPPDKPKPVPAPAFRWNVGEVLETAFSLDGPWTEVPGAESPFRPALFGDQQFFRVRPRTVAPGRFPAATLEWQAVDAE